MVSTATFARNVQDFCFLKLETVLFFYFKEDIYSDSQEFNHFLHPFCAPSVTFDPSHSADHFLGLFTAGRSAPDESEAAVCILDALRPAWT